MKRVLCVWLPDWPLQRLRSAQPGLEGRPLILYRNSPQGASQVLLCSRKAAVQGVQPGMPLAEAAMLLERTPYRPPSPSHRVPHFELYDPQADLSALRELAWVCRQFSPIVGFEDFETPDSLLLDVTGCAHLHGGEKGLIEQVAREFHRRSLSVRAALADTIGAAWAVAHAGREPLLCLPPRRHEAALGRLPVEALRLPDQTVQTLHELGLKRIEQVLALPRADLPCRLGREVLERLDQALGRVPELISPVRPPEPMEATWSSESPFDFQTVEIALRQLVGQVVEKLRRRQEGVQRLELHLVGSNRRATRVAVGLVHPSASVAHLVELVLARLEQVRMAGEVTELRVRVAATAPLEIRQENLFPEGPSERQRDAHQRLARLLDRMSNRLGEKWVLHPRLYPDAQPEWAYRFEPVLPGGTGWSHTGTIRPSRGSSATGKSRRNSPNRREQWHEEAEDNCPLSRPLRFLPEPSAVTVVSVIPGGLPHRFGWQGGEYLVVRSWGPERIETGWWRGRQVRRDYYRIETDTGRRFWLFRQINRGDWFLHGLFE